MFMKAAQWCMKLKKLEITQNVYILQTNEHAHSLDLHYLVFRNVNWSNWWILVLKRVISQVCEAQKNESTSLQLLQWVSHDGVITQFDNFVTLASPLNVMNRVSGRGGMMRREVTFGPRVVWLHQLTLPRGSVGQLTSISWFCLLFILCHYSSHHAWGDMSRKWTVWFHQQVEFIIHPHLKCHQLISVDTTRNSLGFF